MVTTKAKHDITTVADIIDEKRSTVTSMITNTIRWFRDNLTGTVERVNEQKDPETGEFIGQIQLDAERAGVDMMEIDDVPFEEKFKIICRC